MLIECPDCKRQISDQAGSCPHCGRPIKTEEKAEKKPQRMSGCGLVLLIIVVLIAVGSLLPKSQDTTSATSAPPPTLNTKLAVWLKKDTVACPEYTVLAAMLAGHQAGGEEAGHAAVLDLFVHPKGDCVRTFGNSMVRVLDAAVTQDKLTKIEWNGRTYLAQPWNLQN